MKSAWLWCIGCIHDSSANTRLHFHSPVTAVDAAAVDAAAVDAAAVDAAAVAAAAVADAAVSDAAVDATTAVTALLKTPVSPAPTAATSMEY